MKRRRVRVPSDDAVEYCRQCKDRDGFEVKFVSDYIGHGVFTTRSFLKGDFLLEYAGEHISAVEGEKREANYPSSYGSFLFFYGKNKCVDATFAENAIGRFVNDDTPKKANAIMKIIHVDGRQHLCLFAKHYIHPGTELRYDYGISDLPWRKKSNCAEVICTVADKSDNCLDILPTTRKQESHIVTEKQHGSPQAKKTSISPDLEDTLVVTEKQAFQSNFIGREETQVVVESDTGVCADQKTATPTVTDIEKSFIEDIPMDLSTNNKLFEATCPDGVNALANAGQISEGDDNSSDHIPTAVNKDIVSDKDLEDVEEVTNGEANGLINSKQIRKDEGNATAQTFKKAEKDIVSDIGPEGDNKEVQNEGEQLTETFDLVESPKSSCIDRGRGEVDSGKNAMGQNLSASKLKKVIDKLLESSDHKIMTEEKQLAEEMSNCSVKSLKSSCIHGDTDGINSKDQNSAVVGNESASNMGPEGGDKDVTNKKALEQLTETIDLLESLMVAGNGPADDDNGDDDRESSTVTYHKSSCMTPNESDEDVMNVENQSLTNNASAVEIDHVSDSYDSDSESNDPTYQPVTVRFNGTNSFSDSDGSVEIPLMVPSANKVEAGNSQSKKSSPRRPCPFCGIFQAKLTRHIQLKHKDLTEVADAMKAPKKERLQAFDKFKKLGILHENKSQSKEANPQYLQERKCTTGSGKLVMCGNCNGFYHPKFFGRHKKLCMADSTATTVCVPLTLLSKLDESEHADGFFKEILCKIRDDDIGKVCKRDAVIALVGKRLWMKNRLKTDKKGEVRKSVMTSMRRLGSLYLEFRNQEDELGPVTVKEGTSADMFLRNNFSHLEQAIISCTLKGDGGSTDDLKHGLKTALYYLIKKTCKILKGTYLIDDEDEKADSVDKFMDVFDLSHDALFGDASYAMNKRRNENLRKPESLPTEGDILKVRNYTLSRMQTILRDSYTFFDSHAFVELRDLLVCRLTLFNARRGGEPCRLLLSEWQDADRNVWIDEKDVEKLDNPLDRALAKNLKICYQTGKGNRHLVPVLLPSDIIEPLRLLTKDESRATAGIADINPYVFASTQGSLYHVSGWHAVHGVCDTLDLEKGHLLTATKNRHRVSTMYAAMEVPESDRRFFYDHMGHSKQINQDIYQAPLALMEVIKVGKSLNTIDGSAATDIIDQHEEGPSDNVQPSPSCDRSSLSVADVEDHHDTASEDTDNSPSSYSGTWARNTPPYVGSRSNKKARKYTKWSATEEQEVKTYFKAYILGQEAKKLPGRKEVEAFIKGSSIKYDWTTVKTKVMNEQAKAASLTKTRKEEMQMTELQ